MKVSARIGAIAVALALTAALAGCTSATPEPSGTDASGGAAGGASGGAAGGIEPAGQALVQERCTVCHTLERIDAANKDRAGWEATVDKMIGKGAKLTDEEKAFVIDYLSTR